jgi:hypothetical protein
LQTKKNNLSIILVKGDKSISLAIEFDEIANGKDLRTDIFLLSHNKFALLARLRNGSRNIFVCFVLGEACIPAIFLSRLIEDSSLSYSNPVAYFLIFSLQRQPISARSYQSLATISRRDNNDPCLPREVYLGNSPSFLFRLF